MLFCFARLQVCQSKETRVASPHKPTQGCRIFQLRGILSLIHYLVWRNTIRLILHSSTMIDRVQFVTALLVSFALHYLIVAWLTAERAVPVTQPMRMEAAVQILIAPEKSAAAQDQIVLRDDIDTATQDEIVSETTLPPEPLSQPKSAPTPPTTAVQRKTISKTRLRQLQQAFLQEDLQSGSALASPLGIPGPSMHDASEIANYLAMIATKIRENVNRDLCRSAKPETIFAIRLKPDGTLQGSPRLIQSSGVASCNLAIERAILQSLPLPVPGNPESFNAMRELQLRFRPHIDFFESPE